MHLKDGTIWKKFSDGTEIINFTSGEREIRTTEYRVCLSIFLNIKIKLN